jgi:histidinol phosphatase-like enzyme/quercetin dioxygenase-like cupin family protein
MERAVFFDVDGVVRNNNTTEEDGCYYCLKYEDVKYINGIFKAHKFLQDAGYKIFWVTMQNCIKEGLATIEQISSILNRMWGDFGKDGILIDGYHIVQSPEETDESKSIQKAFTINQLAIDNDIDLSKSIGIGDRKHDIDAYKMAGIGTTIQAINPFGDYKYMEARYHYHNRDWYNESLVEVLRILHGITDIPVLLRAFDRCTQVDKVWGKEYWIVNDEQYCSKILELQPDHISSLHYHIEKCETFTVLAGVVRITHQGEVRSYIKGESVTILPEDNHRFEAVESPAVILETSTHHEDADTVRIEESK